MGTVELPDVSLGRAGRSESAIRLSVKVQGEIRSFRIPVYAWGGGTGPATLVLGGQHGNEYEGPLILKRILDRHSDRLRGNLILVPALNLPALQAATRVGPFDQLDLNRSFPGSAAGSPSEQIAHAVSEALVSRSGVVLDVHSGGTGTSIVPSVMMHVLKAEEETRRMVSLSHAFDIPIRIMIDEGHKLGMLDTYVEGQGKPFYCAEIGGGMLTAESVDIGVRFVESFLVAFGHLDADPTAGMPKSRFVQALAPESRCLAANDGVFSPFVRVGQRVLAGDAVGEIASLERPDAAALAVTAARAGIVFMVKANGLVKKGGQVAIVAEPADRRFRRMASRRA